MQSCSIPRTALRKARGLTLVEGLVCLSILAALTALAAPGFRDALLKQRVAAAHSSLGATLQWTRWEALRSNANVSLTRRTDCTTTLRSADDWHCGWDVVAATPDGPQLLQRFDLPDHLRLVHAGGGANLPFSRLGQPLQVAHKFVLGLPADTPLGVAPNRYAITLCMNRTGRVRAIEGSTSC